MDECQSTKPGATPPVRKHEEATRVAQRTALGAHPAEARKSEGLESAPSGVDSRPSKKIRQRPTLPRGFPRSTIGSGGLNFRVRDGNGCDPSDIATGNCSTCQALPYGAACTSCIRKVEFISVKKSCALLKRSVGRSF